MQIPKTKPSNKWWRNRNHQRPPKLLGSHYNSDNKQNNGTTNTLKPDPTSNHCVRNLYQNQGESSTSTSTASTSSTSTTAKKDVTPEDQLTNLIEEKIDKLKSKGSEPSTSGSASASSKPSTSKPVANYCENSRSSIKSLLECFNRKDGSEIEGGKESFACHYASVALALIVGTFRSFCSISTILKNTITPDSKITSNALQKAQSIPENN